MSKYFEETVRLQSEIRREWIREIRGKRLQAIVEGASSAPHLASSSAASFPGRNECPGTHCSLIEQEEREDSSCWICHKVWDKRKDGGEDRVARTERESDSRRREIADFMVLPRPAKSVQNGTGFSGKTGTNWACRKGKSGLSAAERAVGKYAGAALSKRKSRQSRVPDHEGGESQDGREPHLGESEGEGLKHGVERVDFTMNEGRFQGGSGGQAR